MIIALENIRSLYNVGSIFRTASFFGIKKVLLVGYSGREKAGVDKLHEKIAKTALGAEKDLEVKFLAEPIQLIKFAKNNKLKLVVVEQDKKSISLQKWRPKKNSVLVFGNELQGCSLQVLKAANEIVEIPCLGKKKSLNVAIVAGVVLFLAGLRASNGEGIHSQYSGSSLQCGRS
ncbi:MAG: TrmH family RNA methyltransferase [Patescibacteria group bacterium]|nr:TrmH family RNA methyltransferase [Patescibacteria group bacterium]